MMPWSDFLIIAGVCIATILAFRVLPMVALSGKELPPLAVEALDYIPVAAFSALIANDLFSTGAFASGAWPALLPYVAALPVVAVAVKTKSFAASIVVGVAAYALLLLL